MEPNTQTLAASVFPVPLFLRKVLSWAKPSIAFLHAIMAVGVLLACESYSAIAQTAPVLTNIAAVAQSPGTAIVTWQTDRPATSQVVLPDIWYGTAPDGALVTSHRVTLPVSPGTSYRYYVVSAAQGVAASSAALVASETFSTPNVDPAAPADYRLDTHGASSVYAGHDLYIGITSVLLGGSVAHLYFDETLGLPPGVTFHVICAYNTDLTQEHNDSYWDATGRQWCYNGNNTVNSPPLLRVRTSATTPPGNYSATLRTEAGGIERDTLISFSVANLPAPPVRLASPAPEIPGLSTWQQTMSSLGAKWCNPEQAMVFGSEPQIWYYDGGRTYFQIADYTGSPQQWNPCALNIVTQYRDYILQSGAQVPGWRVFPHGLAMNYWRTGDTGSRDAAIALSKTSPYGAIAGGVSVGLIRETAYVIEAYTIAERLGAPHDIRLDRAVDFGLGHFSQLFSSNNTTQINQPFFDGLMAEALIEYYEFSHDLRIPGAIKQMLDWLWLNAWDPAAQGLAYSTLDVPPTYEPGLNNLIAPAYAWYWALTGDSASLQRGDQMFAAAMAQDFSYSGKVFNQNYRWTFDYVRWRTQGTTVPSAFLAGSGGGQPGVQAALQAVTIDPAVTGGGTAAGTVWLSQATSQAASVVLAAQSDGTPGVVAVPGTVTVPAGAESARFTVAAANVTQPVSVTLTASLNGGIGQATTRVIPAAYGQIDLWGLYAAATLQRGGATVVVYLTAAAPAGGITVTMTSSNPAVISLPATVMVPAGATQLSVPITVAEVTAATGVGIQAMVRTAITKTVQVLPPPPAMDIRDLSVAATLQPGSATVVVYLTAAAPAGGVTVTMTSSDPVLISVPATVVMPAGAMQLSVPITVGAASVATNVSLQAKVVTAITRTVQVVPPVDIRDLYTAATFQRGNAAVVVYLTAAAPAGGVTVTMSSSNPALISVPATVVAPAGALQVSVPITVGAASVATNVSLQAKVIATVTRSAQVLPPPPIDVAFVYTAATFRRGNATVVVYLTAAAPARGITVTMSSSNPSLISVPATVVVPAGAVQLSVPITVGATSVATNVSLQAKVVATITRTVQVLPPPPIDVYGLYTGATFQRGSATVVVYLTDVAPAGGVTVMMTSSNPALISVPATVVVPAGAAQLSVPITVGTASVATNVSLQARVVATIARTVQVLPPAL